MTTDFDALPHEEQLERLQALANTALGHIDLPDGASAVMIYLSENATYRVDDPAGGWWALRVHREVYHSKSAIAS